MPQKPTKPSIVTPTSAMTLPTKKVLVGDSIKDYVFLFYGQPGVGKTTFVNQFGEVLFLSTDRGTRFMEAMSVDCNSWDAFERIMAALEKPTSPKYDFICIDHIDDWCMAGEEWVLKKLSADALADPGYGKGWSLYRKTLHRFLIRLKRLGCGIVFIAHETIKTVKVGGEEVDKVMPMLSKQAWQIIIPLCHVVGYCAIKPVIDTKTKRRIEMRVLETQPRRDLYVKDRTSVLRKRPQGAELLLGREFLGTFKGVK